MSVKREGGDADARRTTGRSRAAIRDKRRKGAHGGPACSDRAADRTAPAGDPGGGVGRVTRLSQNSPVR